MLHAPADTLALQLNEGVSVRATLEAMLPISVSCMILYVRSWVGPCDFLCMHAGSEAYAHVCRLDVLQHAHQHATPLCICQAVTCRLFRCFIHKKAPMHHLVYGSRVPMYALHTADSQSLPCSIVINALQP